MPGGAALIRPKPHGARRAAFCSWISPAETARPDGTFEERWWSPVNSPVLDEDGEVEAIIHNANDITEKLRADAALRESEARFRLMADVVPQLVSIADRHGRMEFLNRRFVEYTGTSPKAYEPTEMAANFIDSEDGAKVVTAFGAALKMGEPFEIEHRIRSAANERRWFVTRAEPYRDETMGEVVRWFGASVDIHDRKLAEARLRELNETLERRVADAIVERDRAWTTPATCCSWSTMPAFSAP